MAMFLGDVIVTGKTQVRYENNLTEVQYLFYQVSSHGLEPLAEYSACDERSLSHMCEQIEVVPGNAHVLQPLPAEREYGVGATSQTVVDGRGVGVDNGA